VVSWRVMAVGMGGPEGVTTTIPNSAAAREAYDLVSLSLTEIEHHRFAQPFGAEVDLSGEATLRVA
jgi:hypothetical protein